MATLVDDGTTDLRAQPERAPNDKSSSEGRTVTSPRDAQTAHQAREMIFNACIVHTGAIQSDAVAERGRHN